uniref:apelin receptor A-like n=1 Tax=Pristiophorus japonicus TaxID=55135 RepID=UPI00398EBF16
MAAPWETTAWYDYQTDPDRFCDFEDIISAKNFIASIYCLVFVIGTFGNAVVIVIMRWKRKAKRLVDVFITHLAIADLVFLLTLPLWAVSTALDHRWVFGGSLCKISSYIVAVNMYSSIFFLACISVDRSVAIVWSVECGHLRTRRCAILTSLLIWVLSLALGLPALLFRNVVEYEGRWICSEITSPSRNTFTLATRFIAFLLPLAIITVSYSSVAVKLHRHFHRMKREQQRKRKSMKIGFWIIALFLLAWLPYNVLKTLDVLLQSSAILVSCGTQGAVRKGTLVFTCVAFVNSCVNPIIYLLFDRYFRQSFLQLLPCAVARRLKVRSSTSQPESSRSQRRNSSLAKETEALSAAKVAP